MQRKRFQRIAAAFVILLLAAGVVSIVLDRQEVMRILHAAGWEQIEGALLFSALSYCFLGMRFVLTNRLFDIRLPSGNLFKIGVVSTAFGNLASGGGAGGYSMRILLMERFGVSVKDTLMASLFLSYLHDLILLALLFVSIAYIFIAHPLSRAASIGIGMGSAAIFLFVFLFSIVMLSASCRSRLVRYTSRIVKRLTGRDTEKKLAEVSEALTRGTSEAKRKPSKLIMILTFVAADSLCSIAALGFCFTAFGHPPAFMLLVAGFSLSIAAGLASMIPGGLGIQEVSMVGIYSLLGIPLKQTILSSVLYRVVYYFVPFLLSLPLYRRLFRGVDKG